MTGFRAQPDPIYGGDGVEPVSESPCPPRSVGRQSTNHRFDPKIRLEFRGAAITSDAGLLAFRELDDALGLTRVAADYLQESRTGRNIRHHLLPLLRQSIYSSLAGYDDGNDVERLSHDPVMRVVVGWQGSDRNAVSTSETGVLRRRP